MLKRIDRSTKIANFLEWLSATMAKRRGLPIVIGVVLITVSFVVQLINFAAISPVLDIVWSITHHIGLILAFVGILLVEPLGQ
jgi:hypothetical protein